MTDYLLLVTAFSLGFLGSPHCAGMCGGIVGLLHSGVVENGGFRHQQILYGLAFNSGRLLSYAIAGMIAATLGSSLIGLIGMESSHAAMQMIAGAFMLALGLSIAGWWNGLSRIEAFGARFWRLLQPITARFLPIRSILNALLLGGLWGWLPCGLVYTALILVLASGDAIQGGLTMLAFGLGTLPMLAVLGLSAGKINQWRANPRVRKVLGGVIITFGILTFVGLLNPGNYHDRNHSEHAVEQDASHSY
jgi:sulfite exporter TauE/SafE